MPTSKRDVWVSEVTQNNSPQAVCLGSKSSAPDVFDSEQAIIEYIQSEFPSGEYHLLTSDKTVTVTPTHEMYSDYATEDKTAVEDTQALFENSSTVISVRSVSGPDDRTIQMHRYGSRVSLSPFQYDLVVEVLNDSDESVETVAEWVQTHALGLRVVGWKRATHHKRRGSRGRSTVRVALKRDVGAVMDLVEFVEGVSDVQFCTPAESILFVPRITPRECEPEYILVTDVKLEAGSERLGDDPTPESVLERVHSELDEVVDGVAEVGWGVSQFGFSTSVGGESFYRLAVGVGVDQ